MYLSVKSTQPRCFLKNPAVLVEAPRQVSRLMFSLCGTRMRRRTFSGGGAFGPGMAELESLE